jgi:hypothetical protein
VLGLEAVDRDHDGHETELRPGLGDAPYGARHDLDPYAASIEEGQELVQLAIPDEGLAAHQMDEQGSLTVDQLQDPLDEGGPGAVGERSQRDAREVLGLVGVAPRTREGAAGRDLDREGGRVPLEDPSPGTEDVRAFQQSLLTGSEESTSRR